MAVPPTLILSRRISMSIYSLYWIRNHDHTDINNEGYIGITTRCVQKRFNEHIKSDYIVGHAIRKYQDNIVVDIIESNLSKDVAMQLENDLRPDKEVGWNICKGGGLPPNQVGVIRPYQSERMRGENNIAKRPEVRAKISQALKGKAKIHLRGKKRPEHSALLKKKKGQLYPKFRGTFITPWGEFDSYQDAINKCPFSLSVGSVYNYCILKNNKRITRQSLSASSFLHELAKDIDVIGMSFADIGFGFKRI